ncbi:MAG: O-antigen ligase domain-containing protein, partial [Candidatus Tectomicrobia bacterium]|nr:O-antigen ligase domain-containing protein [Candidatus Tectomicrobia bacterium]
WQNFHIAAYATYVGASLEGLVIDTDHWRHYFLLAGLVWGLCAATRDYQSGERLNRYHQLG